MHHNKNRPGAANIRLPRCNIFNKKSTHNTFTRSSLLFSLRPFSLSEHVCIPNNHHLASLCLVLFCLFSSLLLIGVCPAWYFRLAKTTSCWWWIICSWHRGKRHESSRVQRLFWHRLCLFSPFSLSGRQSIRVGVEAARIEQKKKNKEKIK